MSVTVNDPWRAVKAEIETAAQDDGLSADARVAKLRFYRDELNDLLGRVDTYTGTLELVREGRDPAYREMVLEAREDASLRAVLLERGLATPDEMDELGYLSHDDLDKLGEEQLLEAWVYERKVEEALPGGDAIQKAWDEMKHPRGGHGKFRDVLGRSVHPVGRGGKKVPIPSRPAGTNAPEAVPAPRDHPPVPHEPASHVAAGEPPAEQVQSDLEWARQNGLNDWPQKGDKATEILGASASTQEHHTIVVRGQGGTRVYTPERKQLHDKIIDSLLRQRQPVENSNGVVEMHPHPEGEYLKPPTGAPVALMMGGGTASGKSTALGLQENSGVTPPDAVHIDPDEIKAMIPEYVQMIQAGDKYAATGVHEESSDIAKRLLSESMKRGLNVVRDGTGDSPGSKFAGQVTDMSKAGYDVHMFYVNAPTDVAVVRATKRAQTTGRWVPEPEVRNQHRNVSARFVDHIRPLVEDGTVKQISMWHTEGAPVKFAEGGGGSFSITDPKLYDAFAAKAHELVQ